MSNAIMAVKTMAAIKAAIEKDQGGKFRVWLGKVLPHIGDAYRDEEDGFRSHLGASLLGRKCARELWYGFRWAKKPVFNERILRLFNRGHLEEGRFIAILLTIGCEVYQQDENGNQFRVSHAGGHVGGSLDAIIKNLPDYPDYPVLGEFKAHSDKSFKKLQKEGVKIAKPEHYVQMQIYAYKRNLPLAIYIAVNKNDDELYMELVPVTTETGMQFLDRGEQIVKMQTPPAKLSNSPGWFDCSYCDYKGICHGKDEPSVNCRTCVFSRAADNGDWYCDSNDTPVAIPKALQLTGCQQWTKHRAL